MCEHHNWNVQRHACADNHFLATALGLDLADEDEDIPSPASSSADGATSPPPLLIWAMAWGKKYTFVLSLNQLTVNYYHTWARGRPSGGGSDHFFSRGGGNWPFFSGGGSDHFFPGGSGFWAFGGGGGDLALRGGGGGGFGRWGRGDQGGKFYLNRHRRPKFLTI